MANEQNLKGKGFDSRTTDEQREIAQAGGKASGEARRRKRDIRLALEALLERGIQASDGTILAGAEAIAVKQFEKALQGDTKAFEVVRDTVGQKPTEKVDLSIEDESARAIDDYFAEKYNRPTGK